MATNTTHYNLVKPAYSDSADVAVINTNMDTIDSELYSQSEAIAHITKHTSLTGTTLSDFQSALITLSGQMADGEERAIYTTIGTASGVIKNVTYYGTVTRSTSTRFIVELQTNTINADSKVIGTYSSGNWKWNEIGTAFLNITDTLSYATGVSYDTGGVFVQGKMVVLQLRLSVTNAITDNTVIVKGLPLVANMGSSTCAAFTTSHQDVALIIQKNSNGTAEIRRSGSSGNVPSGTLVISGCYVAA